MLEAGVDAKEKTLAEARHKLAVLDDRVEKKRDMLRKVDEARTELLAGNSNPAYTEALTTIAAADARTCAAYIRSDRAVDHLCAPLLSPAVLSRLPRRTLHVGLVEHRVVPPRGARTTPRPE